MSLGEIAGLAEAAIRTWMRGGGWIMIGGVPVALAVAMLVRSRAGRRFWMWLAVVLLLVGFVLQVGPAFLDVHGLPPKAPGRL